MALIRVTRCYDIVEAKREDEIILNTNHVILVYPDGQKRGSWVQLVHGEPVLIKLTFDEIWMLIQRET